MCLVSYVCLFFLLLTYGMQLKTTCKKLWLHCRLFTGYVWLLTSFSLFILPPTIPTGWKDTQKVGVFPSPTTEVCRCFQLSPPGKSKGSRAVVFMEKTRNAKVFHRRRKYVSMSDFGCFLCSASRLTFIHHKLEQKITWAVELRVAGLLCMRKSWVLLFLKGRSWNETEWPFIHCCVSVSR